MVVIRTGETGCSTTGTCSSVGPAVSPPRLPRAPDEVIPMRTMIERRGPTEDVAKRGGNAGAMGNAENQPAVSHVSHRAGNESLVSKIQRRRRNGSLPSDARRPTTKGGSTCGRGPTHSSILQAHAWTGKCLLQKILAGTVSGRV
jgi:hypothetical protein